MKCQNCKWWQRRKLYWVKYRTINWQDNTPYTLEKWDDKPITEQEILEAKEQDSQFGECQHGCMTYTKSGGCIENDDLNSDNPTDGVIYSDGEAYGAYLYTGENFGCIHFMHRENSHLKRVKNV